MADDIEIRIISFDQADDITAAIRRRETFEVGGCHGRMSEAVQFVERAIGGEGLRSRVYTKGRYAAMAPALIGSPIGVFAAIGMAAHHIATWDPDYEIMKRPIDKMLRVSYVKDTPDLTVKAADVVSDAAAAVGQGVTDTAGAVASAVSDAAAAVGQGVTDSASSVASVVKDNPSAVALGAVVGVAAVAAAPFTGGGSVLGGAALAASLAGTGGISTGAALVGAGVGAAISNAQTEKIKHTAFCEGVEKERAEAAIKIERLSNMMAHAAEVYAAQARLNEFIVSLAAVGFAMASCDGPISEDEKACVEEYVIGMSKIALPQSIRHRLSQIASTPPDFERAILYVQNFDHDIWLPIDGLLEVVGEADGDLNQNEQAFLKKWGDYKIAALKEVSVQ